VLARKVGHHLVAPRAQSASASRPVVAADSGTVGPALEDPTMPRSFPGTDRPAPLYAQQLHSEGRPPQHPTPLMAAHPDDIGVTPAQRTGGLAGWLLFWLPRGLREADARPPVPWYYPFWRGANGTPGPPKKLRAERAPHRPIRLQERLCRPAPGTPEFLNPMRTSDRGLPGGLLLERSVRCHPDPVVRDVRSRVPHRVLPYRRATGRPRSPTNLREERAGSEAC
jgi:hypothetical protein